MTGGRPAGFRVRAPDVHARQGKVGRGFTGPGLGFTGQGFEVGRLAGTEVQALGAHARPDRTRRAPATAGPGQAGHGKGRADGIHLGSSPRRPRRARHRCGNARQGAARRGFTGTEGGWQAPGFEPPALTQDAAALAVAVPGADGMAAALLGRGTGRAGGTLSGSSPERPRKTRRGGARHDSARRGSGSASLGRDGRATGRHQGSSPWRPRSARRVLIWRGWPGLWRCVA